MPSQKIPTDSGIPGLSTEQLVALTVREAWLICGEDPATFSQMVSIIVHNSMAHHGIALPDAKAAVELRDKKLAAVLEPMMKSDGDQRLAAVIDMAVTGSLIHKPVDAETIAAYNQVRTCADKRSFCHAPATSMYFGRDGYVTACCYSRANPLGSYPSQAVDEIWFGDKIKAMRGELRRNILPMGCETCADQLRAHNFKGLLAGNFDSHVPPPKDSLLGKLSGLFRTKDEVIYPTRMEFELSNKCNLECAMCSGLFSSSIRANREQKPPLPMVYDSSFVAQLKPFIPHLKQAKFLGGEPFLIDIYYEIWELFIELNPACEIFITTNGTVFTGKVQRVLENLNCQIILSLDSVEKSTYESIRVNAIMERTLDNLDKITTHNRQRDKPLSMAVCPIVKNWREIPSIVAFANARGMSLFFNTVTFPENESLKFMAMSDKTRALELFKHAVAEPTNTIEAGNYRALNDLCQQLELWTAESSEQPAFAIL